MSRQAGVCRRLAPPLVSPFDIQLESGGGYPRAVVSVKFFEGLHWNAGARLRLNLVLRLRVDPEQRDPADTRQPNDVGSAALTVGAFSVPDCDQHVAALDYVF